MINTQIATRIGPASRARRSLATILSTTAATAALLAGSAIATAAPAQAATRPAVTFTLSTASLDLGQPLAVSVVASSGSRSIKGAVGVYVNGKKAVHRGAVRGYATIGVPATSLRKGVNKVHVNFNPTDTRSYAWRTTASKKVNVRATKVAVEAMKYVGTPYRFGGTTPQAFDCSGFTQYVYARAVGVRLPRVSTDQAKVGKKISARKARPGDLIASTSPGHVAIYLGKGYMIDALPKRTIQPRPVWQKNPTYIRVSAKAIR